MRPCELLDERDAGPAVGGDDIRTRLEAIQCDSSRRSSVRVGREGAAAGGVSHAWQEPRGEYRGSATTVRRFHQGRAPRLRRLAEGRCPRRGRRAPLAIVAIALPAVVGADSTVAGGQVAARVGARHDHDVIGYRHGPCDRGIGPPHRSIRRTWRRRCVCAGWFDREAGAGPRARRARRGWGARVDAE